MICYYKNLTGKTNRFESQKKEILEYRSFQTAQRIFEHYNTILITFIIHTTLQKKLFYPLIHAIDVGVLQS
jgi:hypothetical protein